ncbi:ATP-dependent DNA helicase PcrA [Parasponia andersonii]|uniref:ATP-dependent DNA helicase PcrA n=1 Tax=Parasponia andersonii TaxID=3476 RepID=A0A2P5ASQ9_PARAD|nr:ATP-dependent DNA helicase PcrA [Parasponia andersonii]
MFLMKHVLNLSLQRKGAVEKVEEIMEVETSDRRKKNSTDQFTDTVFSWSLEDISYENLYEHKLKKIPESFQSVQHYLGSYVYPLLEETRAQLYSSMEVLYSSPYAEVVAIEESKPYGTKLYQVRVNYWRNRYNDRSKEPYKTLPGDLLVLANAKPEAFSDLERTGRSWAFLSVSNITEDENGDYSSSTYFKVKSSKEFELEMEMQKSLVVTFLANLTTNKRVWKALHMSRNLKILDDVLCTGSGVEKKCESCSEDNFQMSNENLVRSLSSNLNESQTGAILSSLHMMQCKNASAFELIWGPPGTGKTKTTSTLLVSLLRMKYRTLVCAPTNVAVTELASRVLKMVTESEALFCSLGEILLFGNKERLKVGQDIQEIFLEYRVQRIAECLGPLGWNHSFTSMINFLEDCVSQYHVFLENKLIEEKEQSCINKIKEEGSTEKFESFLEYVRKRFVCIVTQLRKCIIIFCTHLPKSYILDHNFQNMISLSGLLDCFEALLFQDCVVSEALEELFSCSELIEDSTDSFMDESSLLSVRSACVSLLKTLHGSLKELKLPNFRYEESIKEFCFQRASLMFSTASSSYKLHHTRIEPLTILVIDEAAQLKECESIIPLQLPGIKHAVLVGDECQLPATVTSKISDEAGFGRSLFERLSSQNHSKHLLSTQYRMHPSISSFPNSKFYHNQILDAPIVKRKSYEKHYLPGSMFGSYSFINVIGGREEKDDDGHSRKNMVEVGLVMKILHNLYKAWLESRQELSIGVVSPYSAQVVAIQDKLGKKYEKIDGFQVKVKTIDGFQGGEEDVIVMSTVRSSIGERLDFIAKPQRMNVALTRARHCLWILGNERTLTRSQSIWEALVIDAKYRRCFYNADDDKDLAKVILDVKKELNQLDDLLIADSILFKSSKWKVLFSDNFLKSFKKLTSVRRKKSILTLLLKLSSGWRPKRPLVESGSGSSLEIMRFKVEGLYVISTVDITKDFKYKQVLKIWDVLPLDDIPKLIKRLDNIFGKYTENFVNLCNEKSFDGNLEIPKSWPPSLDIVRFVDLSKNEIGSELVGASSDGRSYVENLKVSESLLLMKFYSLSHGVLNHLLSDRDGREIDLPYEVTDEQMETILFNRSSFILGRSGTGKTTVLTMKLFQKEQLHHLAMDEFYGSKTNVSGHVSQSSMEPNGQAETRNNILRQLFVTVSPKLCHAVKQQVSDLQSFACGGCNLDESNQTDDDIDNEEAQFKNFPDSFHNIPSNYYPLVITFHKFLMMLDGTLSNSYFERFLKVEDLSYAQGKISRSMWLQTFIRTKEVNYEKFSSAYWPHFNSKLTKKLDPSRVFTEIISHIKGGLQSLEASDGKLSRDDYLKMSEGRSSNLTWETRERIYDIFQVYEKMKMGNGEFDLADFVNDLHFRLKHERYEADEMDFVYIDEVQDLTMSQLTLFKHICGNVKEGFVFSGDTAQTIARGIDFRFQDIRHLFYKKFVLEPESTEHGERKEKGLISDIFHLSQNFRTHAGILKLSQSIIELIYHFFPLSIDPLKPETSFIYGESPVLLQSGNNENAVIKIFGNSRNTSGNIVGFGAEQVILVRDDIARKEISDYVGKQALLLTILECKGLEFQDVLLYNFFGSSPLKNQWRVLYEYMKEQDLFDTTIPNFPEFSESKHNILCSELKQLYVAVTRTRQRLWICENTEVDEPIFDYWRKKCLVQVRPLDDSFAQAMHVASSPEEWRSQGIKLYHEHNYEMATMCFERACDTFWERMSKAAGLKAMAVRMRFSNPEEANSILREAAEIFEAIDKADSAARCFFELGEYERAGHIYLDKFGESELRRAGECFTLAGRFELAADVYARGSYFTECLNACSKGKLFEIGFEYIQHWKQHAINEAGTSKRSDEIEKIEQVFLESCAFHYHEFKDNKSMMKFVRAFNSMNSIRNFLRPLGCLDQLLLVEEESGNFVEAANIAKIKGDILLMVDLLEKAGNLKEGANLLLFYVLANSLWSPGNGGWPLKQFKKKGELLMRAKSFAKNDTDSFYEIVCSEADIIANEQSEMGKVMNQMIASQRHKSVRGEILSARKILDMHLSSKFTEYFWEEEPVIDLMKHSENMICKNQVTVDSLVYFWNFWKDKTVGIFEYLGRLETQDVNEFRNYGEFCLNFLGVWREFNNLNPIYVLLHPEADWSRDVQKRSSSGKLVSLDVHQFVSAGQSYWRSEMLSVGVMVLDKLKALYNNFLIQKCDLIFSKSRTLVLIYEVAKFLLDSEVLKLSNSETLWKFVRFAADSIVGYIFPMDWRISLRKNMIFLRGTNACKNLLKQAVAESGTTRNKLSYGQIGSMAMIILGNGKVSNELYEKIRKGLHWNQAWKAFFEELYRTRGRPEEYSVSPNIGEKSTRDGSPEASEPRVAIEITTEACLVWSFREALACTYNVNWRMAYDYISPSCFLYLVERLLIWSSSFNGYFVSTKSLFVEWLIFHEEHPGTTQISSLLTGSLASPLESKAVILGSTLEFLSQVLNQSLYSKLDAIDWIGRSTGNIMEHYSLLVSRLVVLASLLCANFGSCTDLLLDLLERRYIAEQLPWEFCVALKRVRKGYSPAQNVKLIAKAVKKIDNPLVMVSLGGHCSFSACPDAIHVNMTTTLSKHDIIRTLFPEKVEASKGSVEVAAADVKVGSEGDPSTLKASEVESSSNSK